MFSLSNPFGHYQQVRTYSTLEKVGGSNAEDQNYQIKWIFHTFTNKSCNSYKKEFWFKITLAHFSYY